MLTRERSFEQLYRSKLKNDLQSLLGRKVLVTNDITYAPLEGEKDTVIAVIKTGQGTKSNIPNYDLTSLPLHITFIVAANYLQELIGKLNSYIKEHNGKAYTLVEGDALTYYRAVYNNPSDYGGLFNLAGEKETFQAIKVLLAGTVVYSSNVVLDQYIPVLKVDGVEYPMNFLLRAEDSLQPIADPLPLEGKAISKKSILSLELTYSFTMLAIKGDPLTDYLNSCLINNIPDYQDISLKIDGETFIPMQYFTLTRTWNAGTESYVLTVVR